MKKIDLFLYPVIIILFSVVICLLVSRETNNGHIVAPDLTTPQASSETISHIDSQGKLDINQATQQELSQLPGIGEKIAADIIAYREIYGGFHSPHELLKIKGISQAKFDNIKDYIVIR